MLPIPKPKVFEWKVPAGQSEEDHFDDIYYRQTHILRDAIDRVSSKRLRRIFFALHLRRCLTRLCQIGIYEPPDSHKT